MDKQTEQLPGGIGISLEYENRRWRLYRIWNMHSSQELGGLGLDKEQQVWTLDATPIEPGDDMTMIELQRLQGPDDLKFRQECVRLLLLWRASQLRDLYHRPRKAPAPRGHGNL